MVNDDLMEVDGEEESRYNEWIEDEVEDSEGNKGKLM